MDALCSQVQEDVAVMRKSQTDSTSLKFDDWLSAIHLCSPGHWAAEDKIGKNFISIHTPVPGLEKINQNASKLVDAMIHKGPFVRFVWGFGSDNRLNHHPNPSPGVSEIEWRGRKFDQETSEKMGTCPFYLRVERQITWGLPALNAAIFTIRISFIDGNQIKFHPEQNRQLKTALASMTPEGRVYKGVETQTSEILDWLES